MSKKIDDFMLEFAQSQPGERLVRLSQLETKKSEDADLAKMHAILTDLHNRLEAKGQ